MPKREQSSISVVFGGRFPTQRAKPDCLGFLGGPRGMEIEEDADENCEW